MGECKDRRFEEMLYAYELGMLSDEDRAAVEMHQMECEYCFQMAKKFRESARLLQCDPVVRESIHQIASAESDADKEKLSAGDSSPTPSKSWPTWIKTSIAVAAVLLILVFQPWKIEISPHQKALAGENLLAILYFDNLADPEDKQHLGDIVANLLITDISEADNIQVVSNQRLFDILRILERDSLRVIDENTAAEVARRAEARWMLTGNILQVEPTFVITSQLVDVTSGNIIKTQKVDGDSLTTIFALVDRLSEKIKNDLPVPAGTILEPDPLIAEVTTHSQDAYRYYLEGIDYNNRAYYAEAIESFEKALEYDSTFAMVYYYLASLKDYRLLNKAVENMDKTTQKEKYYIESLKEGNSGNISMAILILKKLVDRYPQEKRAYFLLGRYKFSLEQYEESAKYMNMAVELDPLYINAYNMLAYSYSQLGDLDKALEMNDKCIFLAPNEPNPYDSRGDIFANYGMYDKATESYEKALEKKPDFYAAWRNLGIMNTYRGEFVKAESCFQVIAAVEDIYVWTDGKVYLAVNLIYQGKFREALSVLEIGSQEDRKAHGDEMYATYHHLPAIIYENLDDYEHAVAETEMAWEIAQRVRPNNKIYWRRNHIRIMAGAGNIAGARYAAGELRVALEEAGQNLGDYWYSLGAIDRAAGDFENAIVNLNRAISESDEFDYSAHYLKGRLLLDIDRPNEAVDVFTKLLEEQKAHPENWTVWNAEVYYYLGVSFEKSGQPNRAAEQYKKYLRVRKNADPDIKSVIEANKRLASLIS